MINKIYEKVLVNLNQILALNASIFNEVKSSIKKKDNFALNKFNRYCGMLIIDIKNGKASAPIDLLAEEEFLIYLTVLYYRLIRNLISINTLLLSTKPTSENFDSIEFSVGILLRCNLHDSSILYQVSNSDNVRKNIVDSFKYINKGFKEKQKLQMEVDERVIDFYKRLLDGFKNGNNHPLQFTYLKNPQITDRLKVLKNDCDGLYEVYSKYDHFSLYEISPIHSDMDESKIDMIARALAAQIPAINMCINGLNISKDHDVNDLVLNMWRIIKNLQVNI